MDKDKYRFTLYGGYTKDMTIAEAVEQDKPEGQITITLSARLFKNLIDHVHPIFELGIKLKDANDHAIG